MGIIFIGHITSYLAYNVYPIFQIYSSSVSDCYKAVIDINMVITSKLADQITIICIKPVNK